MYGKLLCGGLALALLSWPVSNASTQSTTVAASTEVNSDTVPKISCVGPDGGGTGTGVRVGPTLVLTAAHVANIGFCMVDGELAERVEADPSLDFAILRTSPRNSWWHVACDGMSFGEAYEALGYAKGGPIYRQEVFGTINHPFSRSVVPGFGDTGMMVGREAFIPGMSGGPIVRKRDRQLVGIVIGFHKLIKVSYGRFLSDTGVCAGGLK